MRGQIVHGIVSILLLGLFCIPTIGPSVHALLENHEHSVCTAENEFHFHDAQDECKLCHYLIGIKTFHKDEREMIATVPVIPSVLIPPQCISSYTCEIVSGVRGPPVEV